MNELEFERGEKALFCIGLGGLIGALAATTLSTTPFGMAITTLSAAVGLMGVSAWAGFSVAKYMGDGYRYTTKDFALKASVAPDKVEVSDVYIYLGKKDNDILLSFNLEIGGAKVHLHRVHLNDFSIGNEIDSLLGAHYTQTKEGKKLKERLLADLNSGLRSYRLASENLPEEDSKA